MSVIHRLFAGSLFLVAAVIGTPQRATAQAGGRGPARQEVRGVVKSQDAAAGLITVSISEGRQQVMEDRTYPVAKDVEVVIGGGGDRRASFVLKEGKLADLTPGVSVSLTLTPDNATVESIVAEGPTLRGILAAVDLPKNSITATSACGLPMTGVRGSFKRSVVLVAIN